MYLEVCLQTTKCICIVFFTNALSDLQVVLPLGRRNCRPQTKTLRMFSRTSECCPFSRCMHFSSSGETILCDLANIYINTYIFLIDNRMLLCWTE